MFRYGYLVLGACMAALGAWQVVTGNAYGEGLALTLFSFGVAVYLLSLWARRIEIDPVTRELTIVDLFAFRTRYPFARIVRTKLIRYRMLGIPNGTDVALKIRDGAAVRDVTLFRRVTTAKRSDMIARELRGLVEQ